MKSRTLALLSAVTFCSAAMATGTPTPPPAPSPAPASASADAAANAAATANSTGGSVGNVTSQGGRGDGGFGMGGNGVGGSPSANSSSGPSYSAAESGDITNQSSSKFVNFPQPVWTTVPTPYGCIVSESKAGSFGWSFISGSGSRQFSDAVCTSVRMAEAATLHCHFATAAMLNKAAFEQMYPGQKGDFFMDGAPKNMDPVACDALRRPVLRMAPVMQAPAPVVHGGVASPSVNVVCTGPVTPPARYLRAQKRSTPAKPAPQVCK